MIGRDEIALNAVDCHLRTSICVSHCSSPTLCGDVVEFRFNVSGCRSAPRCEGADHDPRRDPEESPQCRSTSAIGSGRVKSGPLGISAGPGMTSAVVLSAAELKAHRAATRHFR
jgi:hypothetical protein